MASRTSFGVDAAPAPVVAARRAGFTRLAALFAARYRQTPQQTAELAGSVSDLEFTSRYRVPFQFSGYVRQHLQDRLVRCSPRRA